MKRRLVAFLPLLTALLITSCGDDEIKSKQTPGADDCLRANSTINGQAVPDQYIVAVGSSSTGRVDLSIESVLNSQGVKDSEVIRSIEGEARTYHVVKMKADDAEKVKKDSRVTELEPNRVIFACGCFTVVEPTSVTWNVQRVGYDDGTGKTAWVIDTGIDSNHPDLIVDKARSKTFLETGSYEDDNGHGTHVAGIIAAQNNNIGTLGVASGATIVGLKVLDYNGEGKLSTLLAALSYVKSRGKAGDVVNISLGFPERSAILESEIKSVANRGIYLSIAAGNESSDASGFSPAHVTGKNIYTVSAIDSTGMFADFSNYGNSVVDFAAPGVRILSTYYGGKYAIMSGTSMAAPHVAGILLINNGVIHSSGSALNDPDGVGDAIAHN
jgi:subtilisin